MADTKTSVILEIESDLSSLKKALKELKDTIQKTLKSEADINFKSKGHNEVEKIKNKLKTEVKVPVEFQNPKTSGMFNEFQGMATQIGSLISGGVLLGIGKGIRNSIFKIGSEIEEFTTYFKGVLGGIDESDALMKWALDLSTTTSNGVKEVADSFNKFINLGLKPTKEEMQQLSDVAKKHGKDLIGLTEAIENAVFGRVRGLRKFGIQAEEVGDKIKVSFQGVSKEIDKNEQAIFDYVSSLGKLEGIAGASINATKDFSGIIADINATVERMKISIFEEWKKSLKPLLTYILELSLKIEEWIKKNPELVSTITAVVVAITSLLGAVMIAIPIIKTLGGVFALISGPVGWIITIIGVLVFSIWDLWNAFNSGESYVLSIVDAFLEWMGVGITADEIFQGMLTGLKETFEIIINDVIPAVISIFKFFVDTVVAQWQFLVEFTSSIIDIIVGLFTGNIPLAKQGFEKLLVSILNIYDKIVASAQETISKVLSMFSNMVSKMSEMASGIPLIGDFVSKGLKKGSEILNKGSNRFSDSSKKYRENVKNRDSLFRKDTDRKNERRKFPTGKNNKKNNKDPYSKFDGYGGIMNSSGKSGGSKGGKSAGSGGKNKGAKGKGSKEKQLKDDGNKIVVSAIESLQDVLKKTGFDISSEIRRADLFQAKKNAMLEMQKKDGIMEFFKGMKEKYMTKETKTENNTKIEITFNGNSKSSNIQNINGKTRLEDLYKINYSRSGG